MLVFNISLSHDVLKSFYVVFIEKCVQAWSTILSWVWRKLTWISRQTSGITFYFCMFWQDILFKYIKKQPVSNRLRFGEMARGDDSDTREPDRTRYRDAPRPVKKSLRENEEKQKSAWTEKQLPYSERKQKASCIGDRGLWEITFYRSVYLVLFVLMLVWWKMTIYFFFSNFIYLFIL